MQVGKEAELYFELPNGRIKCTACARLCEIPEGKIGLCGIRGVVNNKLRLFVYGKVIAGHIDPIEKKPVTHYRIRFYKTFQSKIEHFNSMDEFVTWYNTKRSHMSLNWDQLETPVQAFYKKIDRRRKQLPVDINKLR